MRIVASVRMSCRSEPSAATAALWPEVENWSSMCRSTDSTAHSVLVLPASAIIIIFPLGNLELKVENLKFKIENLKFKV